MTQGDYLYFKVVIVGDSGVGKSALLLSFTNGQFEEQFSPTIGVDFKYKEFNIDGRVIKTIFWDTAGQERFRNIVSSYYRGSNGIIFVFDVTDIKSFTNLQGWIEESEVKYSADIPKVLVANKCDLKEERVVTTEMIEDFADKLKIPYCEASAKTLENVEQVFVTIISLAKQRQDNGSIPSSKYIKLGERLDRQNCQC